MNKPSSLFDQCVQQLQYSPPQTITNNGKPAGYGSTDDATRYFSESPLYTAVWMVHDAPDEKRKYSPPHVHDFPELNILVGREDDPGSLVYEILIGDEKREVTSPATILIPPHTPHSANILRGTGVYVAVRVEPEQIAQSVALSPKKVA